MRLARAFVADALEQWHADVDLAAAALATSEVVTNALLYSASDVTVAVGIDDGTVWVEVADASRRHPVVRHAAPDATSGRGMDIVEAVTERWGVEDGSDGGKVVWFVVPARSGQASDEVSD